jgi:hypothetical protein
MQHQCAHKYSNSRNTCTLFLSIFFSWCTLFWDEHTCCILYAFHVQKCAHKKCAPLQCTLRPKMPDSAQSVHPRARCSKTSRAGAHRAHCAHFKYFLCTLLMSTLCTPCTPSAHRTHWQNLVCLCFSQPAVPPPAHGSRECSRPVSRPEPDVFSARIGFM